ncbi:Transposase IS66 [mine drainage metagenome]|uniref:Transposase IS66 n=2 Tax=mine drainage metagenome TaxID=410659 RepID=T0ZP81_9ZZZZ
MAPTYEELLKIIESQNEVIESQGKENREIKQENNELRERLKKVEKELRKYHNENTPPSANKHLKGNTQGLHAKGGKRGAPFGHKGITRKQQPDEFNDVDTGECPGCHSNDLEDVDILKRTVEDIPVPVAPKVREDLIHKKKCRNCGKVFLPPQNETPLEGKFGINLMVLMLMMKFILRGVLRKTASFLKWGFAFSITPASVNAVVKRVAKATDSEYEAMKIRVRNAVIVYSDATSFSVLGVNFWVWIFRTENDILLVVRRGKGRKVIREILGRNFSGKLVCDCAWVYNYLKKAIIQRCWAHLLRKAGALESVPGRHFYCRLHDMFEEIKRFNAANPTEVERMGKYDKMTDELSALIGYYGRYSEAKPVVKYITNHFGQWLTCVRYPGIEPTNNLSEQGLRESVVYRRIIGAFRSKEGPTYYERLASMFATWQMRGLDVQAELRKMLISNLCQS